MVVSEEKLEQEHKDFLRQVANEVYGLVRDQANMARFRSQVKLFCEKNEEHQKELEQIKKDYEANPELQKAWQKAIDSSRTDEDEIPDIVMDVEIDKVVNLGGFEDYVWHDGFWGPPTKTADLWKFLTPPPDRDFPPEWAYWGFVLSKQPDDDEILICYYALLAAIYDGQLPDKRIYIDGIYKGTWSLRNHWMGKLWQKCQYAYRHPETNEKAYWNDEAKKYIRDWISRALGDVKAELAGTQKEQKSQNNGLIATLSEQITEEDRQLFLKIEIDIKKQPEKYREAGKWLDGYYSIKNFWLRREAELRSLKRLTKWGTEDEKEKYKIECLELMIESKVYIPIDSHEFVLMMTVGKSDAKLGRLKQVTNKKVKGLLAVLDLSQEEQEKWVFEHLPVYRDSDLSLGAFAFMLRERMIGNSSPSIETVRKSLERLREAEKEPSVHYRFRDAQNALLWECWAKDFLSTESAKRIFVVTWLFTDQDAEEASLGITKFENWPWNQGLHGRDIVYYETFLKDRGKLGNKWMRLVRTAWAKVEAEKEWPATTGQDVTSDKKNSKLDFFYKIYEKTLKALFSAVIEAMKS